MSKRPISITVLNWISIVVGVSGFLLDVYWLYWLKAVNLTLLDPQAQQIYTYSHFWLYPNVWYSDLHPFAMWLFPGPWIFLAVSGVLMLKGINWGRWMLVAWVGYHASQSILHTRFEFMFEVFSFTQSPWESWLYLHFFIGILYIVFRPEAERYFRGRRIRLPQIQEREGTVVAE